MPRGISLRSQTGCQKKKKSLDLEEIPWGSTRPRGPGLREEAGGECIPSWMLKEMKGPERPKGPLGVNVWNTLLHTRTSQQI